MYHKERKALENYQLIKTVFVFCELLVIISVILTFFLLYELSIISHSSLINRGIVYIFILFSVQVLSLIFNGYHEIMAQISRFFFLAIALVFAIFLLIYIRSLPNLNTNSIPFGIAVTLVVILSLLVVCSVTSIIVSWKYEKLKKLRECKMLLGAAEEEKYYSSVLDDEEEYMSRRSKK